MMRSKQCIAMLLAGGQGSRLGVLTNDVAKPAVPYGGKYKIIDFPLSNCTNSGIDVVGVLTQYQPLELNSYIGAGAPWDLDRSNGGVFMLPPYQRARMAEWYKGTANAIYQNISFIEQYSPKHVLILSGDHIYKMDYARMLQAHIANSADVTISVREVPWEETSRFGIMNTDENGVITEFEEKPKKAKSNKASMGVYIFAWETLRAYLKSDEENSRSQNDFGKNIIPAMLADGKKMMAYTFSGYWKDVGTIESLWEANMDLIADPPIFNLYDSRWRIFARNPIMPPHYIGSRGDAKSSLVTEGCEIQGKVYKSVLSAGVRVEDGAFVEESMLMPGVIVHAGARVSHAIISENSEITAGCVIEGAPGKIAVVGSGVTLPLGTKITAGQQVSREDIVIAPAKEVSIP